MAKRRPENLAQEAGEAIRDAVENVKPKLRGWLHAGIWPLAFLSLLVLVVLSDSIVVRAGAAVFMVSALMLFGVSAAYHTGHWSDRARMIWKRLDHANIFILIAGSYTPFALLLLNPRHATILLSVVWGGALLGALFSIVWVTAPRWIYVPLYLLLGWAALIYAEEFLSNTPTAVMVLLFVGGMLYSVGALVYGFKRPDPWPTWFGFHEIFHALTIAAFIVQYVGVSLLAYNH